MTPPKNATNGLTTNRALVESTGNTSLYEIAILTRANSARTIGMSWRKGHLGIGSDGDVTV